MDNLSDKSLMDEAAKAIKHLERKYNNLQRTYTQDVNLLSRNNAIMHEIITEMNEAFAELQKITLKYHPKILRGEAEEKDIKQCSRICKRAEKHLKKSFELQQMHDRVKSNPNVLTQHINIVKKGKE